ncbi:hypothetical protein [Mesobacterium pallidum]|uniref:hypothetical protein n=1 Tax=Mesobacterium pallidum TaxID=2872037 RepID=UPI001EE1B8CE|nr:hypothetical protein [Mesobacterium pallidum]
MKLLIALAALPILATSAMANTFSCNFNMECYETETCAGADFTFEVDTEGQEIRTDAGDFNVVAIRELRDVINIFANDSKSTYLLTVTEDGARFTAQIEDGPQVVTYHGTCEGAF